MSIQAYHVRRWLAVCLILVVLGTVFSPKNALATTDIGESCYRSQMVLDGANRPVFICLKVSGTSVIRVVRCLDLACNTKATNEITPAEHIVFLYDLTLDANGHPVFLQYGTSNYSVWLTHCNDPLCAGNDESTEFIDQLQVHYLTLSMVLDAAGNPVITYDHFDGANVVFYLVHCNDPNCAGSNEAKNWLGPMNTVGYGASMALDANGHPVVAFTGGLIHCNDQNCAGGNDSIIPLPANSGSDYMDIELDSSGTPVIVSASASLKVIRCHIPSCATGAGVNSVSESLSYPHHPSLALDAQNLPVVSFDHSGENRLKLVYCNDVYCAGSNETVLKLPAVSDETMSALDLASSDRPVVGFSPAGGMLTLWLSPFDDMPTPTKEWMEPWVADFYWAGISGGCGVDAENAPIYCPEREVTRAEMAVFVIRALHYPNLPYTPTDPDDSFDDVPVAGKAWMQPWIEEFYDLGITQGCGVDPLIFCPEQSVTRAEMAVFLLRALEGGSYQPPVASHYFDDVPVAGKAWMEPWIDEFYRRGITGGCGVDGEGDPIFCPERPVTRAEMAVFILRAFEDIPNP